MLKITLFCIFTIGSIFLFGQQTHLLSKPKVDERVELLSIAFRLADSPEYSTRLFPEYVKRIENHFEEFRDHELIEYISKRLRRRGIGYDAVMFMAISISDHPPFTPLVPFCREIPEKRWGKRRAHKFLKLLNQFYADTNFDAFTKENKEFYTEISKRFGSVYYALHTDWYQRFFGENPKVTFRIAVASGNGGFSYGPRITIGQKETIYAIMGTWHIDSLGWPEYETERYLPTLVHEFNHSFVNPLVEKYARELSSSGKKLYRPLRKMMRSQAYGSWHTMYKEALVRAAVIKYLKDHDFEKSITEEQLQKEINRGFIWTAELVEELERYDRQRDQFPTFESFMPEIVAFFNQLAGQ